MIDKIGKLLELGDDLSDVLTLIILRRGDPLDADADESFGNCRKKWGSYTILINADVVTKYNADLTLILAHELIHLEQLLTGRLQFCPGNAYVFEGSYFYSKRGETPPYEAEAYARQDFIKTLLISEITDLEDQLKNLAR